MRKFASLTIVFAMAVVLVAVGVSFACGNKCGAKTASAQMTGAKACPLTGKTVKTADAAVKETDNKIMMNVSGMTCQRCVTSITKSLASVEGVSDVVISLEDGTARVAYDAEKVKPEALTLAVVKAGYKAELAQVDMKIDKNADKVKSATKSGTTSRAASCIGAKKCDPAACPIGKAGSE